MNKKAKCYGRKKTTLLEKSVNRAFFEKFNPQTSCLKRNIEFFEKESWSSSGSKENSKNTNLKFSSLFPSFCESTKPEESSTWKKKVSVKNKLHLKLKFKKYKGKRKFHNNVVLNKEPNWSSILEHSLAVENCRKKVESLNFNEFLSKDINTNLEHGTDNLKAGMPKKKRYSSKTVYDSVYPIIALNISPFQNASLENEIIYSSQNKNLQLSVDAIFSSHVEQDIETNFNLIPSSLHSKHTQSDRSNSSMHSQKVIPITSTPLNPSKRIEKCVSFLNMSVVCPSQKKRKLELSFESSFVTKMSTSKANQSRSLKLYKKSTFQQINNCMQNERSLKSHSNKERSFFLKSISNPIKVLLKGSDDSSVLHKLLQLCNQTKIMAFMEVYDWKKSVFRKVGEGSYGEVFMYTKDKKSVIIKVIPVTQDDGNNLQSMENVYSEIKVSQCLNQLRFHEDFRTKNFNLLKKTHVVQGTYPVKLLGAWDVFSNVKTTYNYRPDVFDDQQIFVILELEYGGKDMTSFVLRNGVEAESVLKQIAISLAIAEEKLLFEHRDLHLGNILVQRNKSKNISYKFRGKSISIASEGVLVTIIDFTLSRILNDGCVYYNDLAEDDSLFNQSGDFQFDVYRETKLQLKNQWHECLLYSNVLWLNFLCLKFKEHEYSRPSTLKHTKSLQNMKIFADKLKTCKSALDCLLECNIVSSLPDKTIAQNSKQTSEICFVDRKSFQQKSNLFNKI